MKVLWLSNCRLGNIESRGSGSWLYGMRDIISSNVELYNITKSNVKEVSYNKYDDLEEYIIPDYRLENGVPSSSNILKIKKIINKINPDVIHIWGIELYWGLLFTRNHIQGNYIIEIQGLLSSCHNVYYGGLSPCEICKCFNIKELIKFNSFLPFQKRNIIKNIAIENEIIANANNISTQSDWIRDQIKFKTKENVNIFKTLIPVRKTFYKSEYWNKIKDRKSIVIFTSFSYVVPFKGFHILLKSIALLKQKYPHIILNVGGFNIKSIVFYKKDGYMRYLLSLIYKYNIVDNVNFMGSLNEEEIREQLLRSDVFINPSFVESYSVSSAEALYLGVPSILSFAGAMPNFSSEKKVALYYSPTDYVDLASKTEKIINDKELSKALSDNSISIMNKLCDIETIKRTQLSIYNQLQEQCLPQ
jgi:glycosyltransferase involved in cell wall biosynthesis